MNSTTLMPWSPAWSPLWKLFEEANVDGMIWPKTLVHPVRNIALRWGGNGRIFLTNVEILADTHTKGFNLFLTKDEAVKYLPRFIVRAPKLVLCRVWGKNVVKPIRSNYALASSIFIYREAWGRRFKGKDLISGDKNA